MNLERCECVSLCVQNNGEMQQWFRQIESCEIRAPFSPCATLKLIHILPFEFESNTQANLSVWIFCKWNPHLTPGKANGKVNFTVIQRCLSGNIFR